MSTLRHQISLTLDSEEVWRGTIDGLECYSDIDRIGIKFQIGWRTLGWHTSHLKHLSGQVEKGLIHLWGVYHKLGTPLHEAT